MISKGHRERLAKNCECVIGASVVYVTVCYSTVEYRIAEFHELLLEESARECVPKKQTKKYSAQAHRGSKTCPLYTKLL